MSESNSSRETRASQDLTHLSIRQVATSFRNRGRGSRSPSPAARVGNGAFFPETTAHSDGEQYDDAMAPVDVEELQRIAKTAADAAAAASAALTAMAAQLTATQQDNTRLRAIKKPDLPNFDHQNIEIWIRRVESAFTRAGVETTKDKFAFLEGKLSVDLDPRINSFLFGTINENTWSDFTSYLTKKYGRTKQQRTNTLIDGIEREGRRPSEMAALLCNLTRDVTIEDVRKEQIMKKLPVDVRRALAKESENLSLEELVEAADHYFDQQGRPKFNSPTSTINAVDEAGAKPKNRANIAQAPTNESQSTFNAGSASLFTSAFPAADDEINAVPSRPTKPGFSKPPTRATTTTTNNNSSRPGQRSSNQTRPHTFDADGNCYYHATFGNKADKCFPGCKHPSVHAGNDRGGRRK